MTTQERDQLIRKINDESGLAEDKARRIAVVNQTYSNVQTQTAEAAKRTQETAESSLKTRLKHSYMQNPAADEASFEADYPQLRSEYMRNETLNKDAVARNAMARRVRESF